MAESAGLRRVGAEAERGLREEGGDWRACERRGTRSLFHFFPPECPLPTLPLHTTLFAREPGELAA